jgi:diguanylate cyclase (GGDEF)-like protein
MTDPSHLTDLLRKRVPFHWSFIRVGLWASLAALIILISAGIWSYQHTNQLARQAQEQAGNGLAVGLANALEETIILRNFAQIEVQVLQTMNSEQVQSILVTDTDGTILSEARRDLLTGKTQLIFKDTGKKYSESISATPEEDTLLIVKPIGNGTKVGWVKLQIAMSKNNALLKGIHQQLLLMNGFSAIIMLVIIGFSLRNTYTQIRTTHAEIEDLNDSLHTAAFYDQLTKLPNRPLLRDRLRQALALASRTHHQVAVCYLDLDGFKQINDIYGHDYGDTVLVEVSKRLTMTMRQHDTVARVGGDEFVLVINDLLSLNDCKQLLNRVLIELAQPIDIGHHMVTIGASIGVASSHEHGINPSTLITLADKAMYQAKRSGKNQWCIYGDQQSIHT